MDDDVGESSPPPGPAPAAATGTRSSRDMAAFPTSSCSVTEMVNGSHGFVIQGYTLAKRMGVGKHIVSEQTGFPCGLVVSASSFPAAAGCSAIPQWSRLHGLPVDLVAFR